MGLLLILQILCLVLNIWAAVPSLLIQGSAVYTLIPSPSTLPGIPDNGRGIPSPISKRKPLKDNASSPEFQPIGKDINHTIVFPSPTSAPLPQAINDVQPIPSPTTSTVLPPYSSASSPQNSQGSAQVLPPSAPQKKPPQNWGPVLAPKALVTPMPPTSHQRRTPVVTAPLSSPPVGIVQAPRKMPENPPLSNPIISEAPSSVQPVHVAPTPNKLPRYSPSINISPTEPSLKSPEPHLSPAHSPSINWKRDGKPVAVAPYGKHHEVTPANSTASKGFPPAVSPSKAKTSRHSHYAPPPLLPPRSPSYTDDHAPAPLPSTLFHRYHHLKKNTTSPSPSYLVPSYPSMPGSLSPTAPSYPSKPNPKINKGKHVHSHPIPGPSLPPLHPILPPSESYSSPTPSTSPTSSSRQVTVLSPPPGGYPRKPIAALPPSIRALPPPPPNEYCAPLTCKEPLTNTPPGTPCYCVWPMQVGLRLNVALYTFFPLVSELANEIAIGVFMKLSQVRIMGANAASEDPEKTIVLLNLVPLGERFDSTTAYLAYQRFWNKKVVIKTSYFGDYEVLYVRYPGLPPSPPLPPSNVNIINSDPFSGHDNKGRSMKPLGVDVKKAQRKHGLDASVIAIIVLSASMAAILCCALIWILLFRRREHTYQSEVALQNAPPLHAKSSGIPASIGSGPTSASLSFGSSMAYTGSAKTFSSSEIERATDNFNVSRILGEGGFGRVYSGLLEDGVKVAVKVLKRDDQQGGREFLAEVEMLSRLHHRNLVKLIGICTEDRTRCLVYELIPNGSVESHLHGLDKESAPLDWGSRMKIALGAARGLAYLHEDSSPRVIHRDFKSSNILLEHDFTPKVSDFGLARTALDEENSHISTRVMGTFGYVAPEYAMTGHLLVKSDVYSYGVVLLELLTGRKPVDMSQPPGQENLVAWARPLLTSKQGLESIVDPSLGPDFPFDSIAKVAAIASMCVQPEVSHRPFMGEVVQALKLVCNDTDETKELGSRTWSREDLSVDMDARISNHSDHLPDNLQNQSPFSNYDSGTDVERGLPVSEMFSSSARYGRQDSGSFRRHSSSGPLGTRKDRWLWPKIRGPNRGSMSERGLAFKWWRGSH